MNTGYAITEKQSHALDTALKDLLVLSEAESVFMSDNGGNLLASFNADPTQDMVTQTVSAMAAAAFNATRELAGLVKEREFRSIHHQGATYSIYMQALASEFILLVVFGKTTPVGLVKLYAERTCRNIESIIASIDRSTGGGETPPGFRFELADTDKNTIF